MNQQDDNHRSRGDSAPPQPPYGQDPHEIDLLEGISRTSELDLEPDEVTAAADSVGGAEETDELDLSDLDDIADAGEEPEVDNIIAEASDDLELDLDMQEGTADEELAGADELDLSDLDGMLESDEASNDDLVLDFEVDDESASGESSAASEELEMSDLEKMVFDYEGLRLKMVGLKGPGTSLDIDSTRDEKKFNRLYL